MAHSSEDKKLSACSSEEEILASLEAAITRLMHENAAHRELFEEIQTTLRFRAGSEASSLNLVDAIKFLLTEKESLVIQLESHKQLIWTIRSLISDGRSKDALECIRQFLRQHQ